MNMNNVRSLNQVASVKLGLAFKSAIKDLKEQGSCFLIQTKDISQDGSIEYDQLSKVIPEGAVESHLIKPVDVILRLRGPIFTASIVDLKENLPIITTNQLAVIRCHKDILCPYYLHWYLNSKHGQHYLNGVSEGTSMIKISAKIVSDMTLMIPSIEQQLNIGKIHRNWLRQKNIYKKLIDNGSKFYGEICNELQKEGN